MDCNSLLLPDHFLMEKTKGFGSGEFIDDSRCHLRVRASLSRISHPSRDKPTLLNFFTLRDITSVTFISPDGANHCSFPCPLNNGKHFVHRSLVESSRFVRSTIPLDIPFMETWHRDYFVSEMSGYISAVIREAGDEYHVNINAAASIVRDFLYDEDEMDGLDEKIEGLRSIKKEDADSTNSGDCAVCLEEVEMSQLQGVKLGCSHEFHLACIAPWFVENDTCPMCRRVQVVDAWD